MPKSLYEYIIHNVGEGMKIELRRKHNYYEFRPVYNDEPKYYIQIEANAELRCQGGAWCPVPEHLLAEARGAFDG